MDIPIKFIRGLLEYTRLIGLITLIALVGILIFKLKDKLKKPEK